MLTVPLLNAAETERAASIFHRDGFLVIQEALNPEQLRQAHSGAFRVIREQTEATALDAANRGYARYSFGDQLHHPEWAMLIDLPAIQPILDAIWSSPDYTCMGGGGDYSVPGAQQQPLHTDMGDFFHDPTNRVTYQDVPAPFIVVNFPVIDFTERNGAIRFVPGTQRSREAIPSLEDEPEWMRAGQLAANAGAAIIRDVRCWHGGCANVSDEIRPMLSVGYYAPWFRPRQASVIPQDIYAGLNPRAQALCRTLVVQ